MRVWDISAKLLCDKHLLGQHNEIHIIWNTLTKNSKAWSSHPETLRWKDNLCSLLIKHNETKLEMIRRSMKHKSEITLEYYPKKYVQTKFVNTIEEQVEILKNKGCKCHIGEIQWQ